MPSAANRSAAFPAAAAPPSAKALADVLGRTGRLWRQLTEDLQTAYGPLAEEWNFGNPFGWSFRLKEPKRAVVYMTPRRGHFIASLALGEKACAAAKQAGLPASILTIVDDAPRYAEGRGVRIPVRTGRDLAAVVTLASIKMGR